MVTFNPEVMYWPSAPCKHGHNSPYYKRGHRCAECRQLVCLSWRRTNPEKEREKSKQWRDRNREHLRKLARQRYMNNPSKRERDRAWKKAHPHIFAALQVKREAAKKRRTPKWADMAMIKWVYSCAPIFSRETGIAHHVDHVVPLNGENVCGLHVHQNLTIIPATENMRKKNKWDSSRNF